MATGIVEGMKGVKVDHLWTNSSPTTTFAAQNVGIGDLSHYNWVSIITKVGTSTAAECNSQIYDITPDLQRLQFPWGTTTKTVAHRNFYFLDANNKQYDGTSYVTGIHFSTAAYNSANNNGIAIPVEINGIKFV